MPPPLGANRRWPWCWPEAPWSGGAFKVGGLKALDDFFVGPRITDLDVYVGLSAGSILAASLASGITPDEMIDVLDGTSQRFEQLRPIDFYNPNFREFAERPAKFGYDLLSYLPSIAWDFALSVPGLPDAVGSELRRFVKQPSYTRFESLAMRIADHVSPNREVPALTNHIPGGLFDNASLERWLRRNLERNEHPQRLPRLPASQTAPQALHQRPATSTRPSA